MTAVAFFLTQQQELGSHGHRLRTPRNIASFPQQPLYSLDPPSRQPAKQVLLPSMETWGLRDLLWLRRWSVQPPSSARRLPSCPTSNPTHHPQPSLPPPRGFRSPPPPTTPWLTCSCRTESQETLTSLWCNSSHYLIFSAHILVPQCFSY